jgi:hypothetical protein
MTVHVREVPMYPILPICTYKHIKKYQIYSETQKINLLSKFHTEKIEEFALQNSNNFKTGAIL